MKKSECAGAAIRASIIKNLHLALIASFLLRRMNMGKRFTDAQYSEAMNTKRTRGSGIGSRTVLERHPLATHIQNALVRTGFQRH